MVSLYSHLTDKELDDLHVYFTEKYGKLMLDESQPIEERHLGVLMNRKKQSSKPDIMPLVNTISSAKMVADTNSSVTSSRKNELHCVQECAKEVLFRQLKYLSLAIYLCMDKNKNWGVIGEQRITISLCRNILTIPNNRGVTVWDAIRFHHILDEYDKTLGRKSAEEMIRYCKDKTVNLFGKDFYFFSELHEFIKLFDAEYYFYSSGGPYGAEFIFGKVTWTTISDTPIYTFQDEYIHSPSHILSIAGRSPSPMQIRRNSLEVICFNKWEQFFDRTKAEQKRSLNHPNSAIRDALKEKALFLYGSTSRNEFLKIKSAFIDQMADGVIWHEFGHEISHSYMDQIHQALSSNIPQDDTITCAFGELMAEWAPKQGDKKGAITYFLELADFDRNNAAAQFFVFLSDNWYMDEEEGYLRLRSYSYLSLGLYFIEPDGSINFERMSREHNRIFSFLVDKFRCLMENLLDALIHAVFWKNERQMSYHDLEAEIVNRRQQDNAALTAEDMKKQYVYWGEILSCLKETKEGWKQFQNFMKEEEILFEQAILDLVTGGNAGVYDNSLRNYIIERCQDIGIYRPY